MQQDSIFVLIFNDFTEWGGKIMTPHYAIHVFPLTYRRNWPSQEVRPLIAIRSYFPDAPRTFSFYDQYSL
jgi:hypothetical protein